MEDVWREAKPKRKHGKQAQVEAILGFFKVPKGSSLEIAPPMAELVLYGPKEACSQRVAASDGVVPVPSLPPCCYLASCASKPCKDS